MSVWSIKPRQGIGYITRSSNSLRPSKKSLAARQVSTRWTEKQTAFLVAAKANNGIGVAGVDFNAGLVMCRALGGPLGSGSTADVANCITWVSDKGAKVISMSLGGGDSTTLHQAVQYAWKNGNGALVVAAAGNDGDSTLEYPAAYSEVVSVAATDNHDARASFSKSSAFSFRFAARSWPARRSRRTRRGR